MSGAPVRLAAEYLTDPVGLPDGPVRLSWWSGDDRQAEVQSGYQIQASSSREALGDADLWDTDRVAGAQRTGVVYEGAFPEGGGAVFWHVRTFDSDGLPGAWSEPAVFEVWHPNTFDHARWVTTPLRGNRARSAQVPVLRRSFELAEVPRSARLSVAALGVLRVAVNGQSVESLSLAPGWSSFSRQLNARTVALDGLLEQGANTIQIELGDGAFSGAVDGISREHYGEQARLIAELRILAPDGQEMLIGTDHEWQWHGTGTLSSDAVLGENTDGRVQTPSEDGWRTVDVVDPPAAALRPGSVAPLVSMERISVGQLLRQMPSPVPSLRRWQADLGVAVFGQIRVTLRAARGDYIRVAYASSENEDGSPLFETADEYTAGGEQEEVFAPLFSMHGARWIEIVGDCAADAIVDVTLQQVGSGLLPVSGFESDHSLLNRYHEFSRRTLDNVLLDVPVAGIGARERVGRLATLLPVLPALPYTFSSSAYLSRWVRSVCLENEGADRIAPVYPPVRQALEDQGPRPVETHQPSSTPNVVGTLVVARAVWTSYRAYGDRDLVALTFPELKRFAQHLQSTQRGLICTSAGEEPFEGSPQDLVATALFFETVRLLTRMGGVLGRLGEMESFDGLAQRIRSAFRRRFVTPDGALVGDDATSLVLALDLGLLEGDERSTAMSRLEEIVRAEQYHLCVHPLLADRMLEVLVAGDRLDLAYAVLQQTSGPSWLEPVLQGAKSATNALPTGALSFLHRHVVGLREDPDLTEEGNAFRHVVVQPRPPVGAQFPEGAPLSRVDAHHDSIHGRYEVAWQVETEQFVLNVLVPCGCQARVILPDGETHQVGAGRHLFAMPLVEDDDGIPVLQDSLNS